MDEKLRDIDKGLNALNTDKILYIYGGVTQQPIERKWQQQAELRQPREFDFTWNKPTPESILTTISLIDKNITLDAYKSMIEYVITYLVNRLYVIFGKNCVNPYLTYQFNNIEYGNVYQFYVFQKDYLK
jgi:hypothetical protein